MRHKKPARLALIQHLNRLLFRADDLEDECLLGLCCSAVVSSYDFLLHSFV